MDFIKSYYSQFARHFGAPPETIVRAPGRVNLIGEHTDYNDGYVLPVAIDRTTYVAARRRDDQQVRLVALNIGSHDSFELDQIVVSQQQPWSNYLRGVASGLLQAGHALPGAELLIASTVPYGGGLSSSAALTLAGCAAFQQLAGLDLSRQELALLAQQAERFVGVDCGIMDQFASAFGLSGHALLLDCRSLDYRHVPLPEHVRLVVCNSHIERTLAGSAYNQRRKECEAAVAALSTWLPGLASLRDLELEQLERYERRLDELPARRARHVVSENQRVLRGVAALEQDDAAAFGQLMNESHASLRDDYQVSLPQLDLLVELAQSATGCYGSRLTGAGFGGCTISLVELCEVERFKQLVGPAYYRKTGRQTSIYVCQPGDGLSTLDLELLARASAAERAHMLG